MNGATLPDTPEPLILVSPPEDGVARMTLNRPEKSNALTVLMRDEMVAALGAWADPEVRALVLTGAGSVFCAGFDLSELDRSGPVPASAMTAADRFHQAIFRFPLPVVVAVNGPALWPGASTWPSWPTCASPPRRPLRPPRAGLGRRDLPAVARSGRGERGPGTGPHRAQRRRRRGPALRLVSQVVPANALIGAATEMAARIAAAPREVLVRMKAKIVAATGIPETATTLEL